MIQDLKWKKIGSNRESIPQRALTLVFYIIECDEISSSFVSFPSNSMEIKLTLKLLIVAHLIIFIGKFGNYSTRKLL